MREYIDNPKLREQLLWGKGYYGKNISLETAIKRSVENGTQVQWPWYSVIRGTGFYQASPYGCQVVNLETWEVIPASTVNCDNLAAEMNRHHWEAQ